ncbi:sulfotransferase family protein [Roseibacterium beibuensis]|uniref:Sulfotransferase family protein n=1 Tax=[Roseibacterium] beibuensis TaxID=1193142 RepID=A0ABP9L329_9RHOB|nr:sulfotransferase family protein [Roseibacterium beibuensis]MCS6621751.1 sulfotransferase family protein [Roseibacterium beibuensis]
MKSPRLLYHRAIADLHNWRVLSAYPDPKDHPMLASTPGHAKKAVLSRCYYIPKFGLYYARIPKNANSTISRTLTAHAGVKRQDEVGLLAKNIFNRIPTAEQFRDARKVVFLRDPVARAMSGWKDKGVSRSFHIRYGLCGAEGTPPNFLDFLHWLEDHRYFTNPHFLPQVDLIPGDVSDYGVHVIEDLETGLREVCQEVFGHFGGLEERHSGRTGARSLRENVSDAEMAMIERLYPRDLALYAKVTGQTA